MSILKCLHFYLVLLQTYIVFLVICFTISVSVYMHYFFLLFSCQFRETEHYLTSCARCCFWWVYFFANTTSFIVDGIFFFRPFPSCFSSRNHYIHLNIVTSFIFNFTGVKCIIIVDQHPITNNYLLFPSWGLGFWGYWKSLFQ